MQQSPTLGPEVFRCRLVPVMQWVGTQGPNGPFFAYFLLPILILPMISMFSGLGVIKALSIETQPAAKITLLSSAAIVYLLGIYLCYVLPFKDHLVVYRDGFVVKISFRPKEVSFHEIECITFGLEGPIHRAGAQVVGMLKYVRPSHAKAIGNMQQAAMNVYKKDGSKVVVKQFLQRFDPSDVQQFMDYLSDNYPAVFGLSA